MTDYSFYPGCSLLHSAKSYDVSARLVGERLGMTFHEIEDWNCCGATEYFSVNTLPAYSLVARNLSLASQQNGSSDLVAPCSACFLNLRKTDQYMGKYAKLNKQVNQALAAGNMQYEPGTLTIRHLLDVFTTDVGYERIKEEVVAPLTGLRVAPYYGCLVVRPNVGFNTEYPTHLDQLMKTLGATVVDFPMKTRCCGGHMTQISEDTAYELLYYILHNAAEYEADIIVTLCPMCQLNLDAFQHEVNRAKHSEFDIPVLFFTQLMGLAFGMSHEDVGIGSEIISAASALEKIGQEEDEKFRPKRRDKKALPMPAFDE